MPIATKIPIIYFLVLNYASTVWLRPVAAYFILMVIFFLFDILKLSVLLKLLAEAIDFSQLFSYKCSFYKI